MSKVEEVARALDPLAWAVPEDDYPAEKARREAKQFQSLSAARRAIEAMKVPDVEMLAAFWRQKNNGTQEIGESGDNRSDYDAWRAAMSRALNEEG